MTIYANHILQFLQILFSLRSDVEHILIERVVYVNTYVVVLSYSWQYLIWILVANALRIELWWTANSIVHWKKERVHWNISELQDLIIK